MNKQEIYTYLKDHNIWHAITETQFMLFPSNQIIYKEEAHSALNVIHSLQYASSFF